MSVNYEILQLRKPASSAPISTSTAPTSTSTESPATNSPLSQTDHQHQLHTNQQNPLMFGILGFFAAVFPFSLMQILAPTTSPVFIQWSVFGGMIQVYAATKEFELGHNLSGCIFLVFGANWVSKGLTHILTMAYPTQFPDPDSIIWALWFLVLTILTFAFTLIVYVDKRHGTWLLFWNLFFVGCQFFFCSFDYFTSHNYSLTVNRLAGVSGIAGSLCGLYTFFVEAVEAASGYALPVGRIHSQHVLVDRDRSLEACCMEKKR